MLFLVWFNCGQRTYFVLFQFFHICWLLFYGSGIWSLLSYAPRHWERIMCFVVIKWSVLLLSVEPVGGWCCWILLCLLMFCLVVLSVAKRGVIEISVIVDLFIFFLSVLKVLLIFCSSCLVCTHLGLLCIDGLTFFFLLLTCNVPLCCDNFLLWTLH